MQAYGDDTGPCPRVNKKLLGLHKGAIVRLVGEVKENAGGQMIVIASDHGEVVAHTSPSSDLGGGTMVEIVGTVNPDLSITEISSTRFPDTFNRDNYDQLVNFTTQFPELFQ